MTENVHKERANLKSLLRRVPEIQRLRTRAIRNGHNTLHMIDDGKYDLIGIVTDIIDYNGSDLSRWGDPIMLRNGRPEPSSEAGLVLPEIRSHPHGG